MAPFRVCDREVHGSPATKVFKIIGLVILGIIGFTALAIIFGLVIQWLWNQLMPPIFGLPEISYWQAVGLAILARIFFGCEHNKHVHNTRKSVREKKGTYTKMKASIGPITTEAEMSEPKSTEPETPDPEHMEWTSFREFWNEYGRDSFREWLRGRTDEEV